MAAVLVKSGQTSLDPDSDDGGIRSKVGPPTAVEVEKGNDVKIGKFKIKGLIEGARWESMFLILSDSVLAVFDKRDKSEPVEVFSLSSLEISSLDERKNEFSITAGTRIIRLRSQVSEEAADWWQMLKDGGAETPPRGASAYVLPRTPEKEEKLEGGNADGYWIQFDRVAKLPLQAQARLYSLHARWQGAEEKTQVDPRPARLSADGQSCECKVKMQVLLMVSESLSTTMATVELMETAADGSNERTFGYVEIDVRLPENRARIGKECPIMSALGYDTGATLKVRIKENEKPEERPVTPDGPPHSSKQIVPTISVEMPPDAAISPSSPPPSMSSSQKEAISKSRGNRLSDNPEEEVPQPAHRDDSEDHTANSAQRRLLSPADKMNELYDATMAKSFLTSHDISCTPSELQSLIAEHDATGTGKVPLRKLHEIANEHISTRPNAGQESESQGLNARQSQLYFANLGYSMTVEQIRDMVPALESNIDATASRADLDQALRCFRRTRRGSASPPPRWSRRGVRDQSASRARSVPGSPSPRSQRRVMSGEVPSRILELYDMHKPKLKKREALREQAEMSELLRYQEEANQARPLRRLLEGLEFDPYELTNRLYDDHSYKKERHEAMARRFQVEAHTRIECARTRPPPPNAKSELAIQRHVDRLQCWQEEKKKKLETALHSKVTQEKSLLMYGVCEDGDAKKAAVEKSLKLYEEAEERRQMLSRKEQEWKTREEMAIANKAVGPEEVRPVNMIRINELHAEAEAKTIRRNQEMEQKTASAVDKLKREKEDLKALHDKFRDKRYKNVRTTDLYELPKHRTKQIKDEAQERKEKASKSWVPMNSAHHTICAVNNSVAQRCGYSGEDAPIELLAEFGVHLKKVDQIYAKAVRVASKVSDGGCGICKVKSQSLYSEGQLMDDSDGWGRCCEPDQIRQLAVDLETLYSTAKKAQAILQIPFMNEHVSSLDSVSKLWPADSRYNSPKAFPLVDFAFNPGVKPKDAFEYKASVLYGPAEGRLRYMHVLDLARICLVCRNSAGVGSTLQQLRDRFEVVAVRNLYQKQLQGAVPHRCVDVLIVLKRGLPEPMVCEIRLEEQAFHCARIAARPVLKEVCKGFADIYGRDDINRGCLEFLCLHLLLKPKTSHSLIFFTRQLSRRYGSIAVAWRQLFSSANSANHVSFNSFRDVCGQFNHRNRTVEFWQELDPTLSGRVSLFDLDEEPVLLMAKFLGRALALVRDCTKTDGEEMFLDLADKAFVRLSSSNANLVMDATEFRQCTRCLGFNQVESDRLFHCLDGRGGCKVQPPSTICPADLDWLRTRLPKLIDIPCVILACGDKGAILTGGILKLVTWAEATKNADMNRDQVCKEQVAKKIQRQDSLLSSPHAPDGERLAIASNNIGANLEALWLGKSRKEQLTDGQVSPETSDTPERAATRRSKTASPQPGATTQAIAVAQAPAVGPASADSPPRRRKASASPSPSPKRSGVPDKKEPPREAAKAVPPSVAATKKSPPVAAATPARSTSPAKQPEAKKQNPPAGSTSQKNAQVSPAKPNTNNTPVVEKKVQPAEAPVVAAATVTVKPMDEDLEDMGIIDNEVSDEEEEEEEEEEVLDELDDEDTF